MILLWSVNLCHSQGVSEAWEKSEYIIFLSDYTSWPDEDKIDTFRIGILAEEGIYTELSIKSMSRKLKEKPFRVSFYNRINKIRPVNILFIAKQKNPSINRISKRWKNNPVLLITDSCPGYEYTMINLLTLNYKNNPFEINKVNMEAAGLTISDRILAEGGTEEDLRTIYRESERELQRLRSDISQLNEEIAVKQAELEQSEEELLQRSNEINALNDTIRQQTARLEGLSEVIESKQKDLVEKARMLEKQEESISSGNAEINSLNEKIESREKEISVQAQTMDGQRKDIQEQQALMNRQQTILDEQMLRIETQRSELIFFIFFSAIILVLGFLIYRAYRAKKRINRDLRVKNSIIMEQKEEISAQRDQLEKMNITKDKFFSIIAHDLKNPFQSILGFSELLLNNPDGIEEDKKREYLGMIFDSSQFAHNLLDNLLFWSRSQTDTIKYNPSKLDLHTMINEIHLILSVIIGKKKLEFQNRVREGCLVLADKNMIHTVIRNLISNAIKFTPEKGTITVDATQQDGNVLVSVSDSGIGIPEDKQKSLLSFGEFYTTKGTGGEPGTGLGLIICNDFITKHGGKLSFVTGENKGTTFSFSLPVWKPGN